MSARLMIAAPSGRCGKTTITVGICASLRKRGLVIQPFKKGPDYIDPSWLTAASGRKCRNLDLFMMKKDTVTKIFYKASSDSDIAVIEANMGFYDCVKPDGSDSPASLARLFNTPVLLVINSSRMTRSVAALLKGYLEFEPENHIKGVILNNVAGTRHERKLIDSIKRHCNVQILGVVPKSTSLSILERHLGLIPYNEYDCEYGEQVIGLIGDFINHHINIDEILSIAGKVKDGRQNRYGEEPLKEVGGKKKVKIAVFYDRAFSFYYPENLEALQSKGAELVFINSMKDNLPSDIDGLYIGGGFPELYSDEISKNHSLMTQVAEVIEDYMPVYAECAGLMYLSKGIVTEKGFFEMTGIIPSSTERRHRPQGHGYMDVEVIEKNPFFKIGSKIRGHEFHYSALMETKHLNYAFKVKRGYGIDGSFDGIVYKNMFASYMHIHALSVPQWAENFVKKAEEYRISRVYENSFSKKGVCCYVR